MNMINLIPAWVLRRLASPSARALFDSITLDQDDWVINSFALAHKGGRFLVQFGSLVGHTKVTNSRNEDVMWLSGIDRTLLTKGVRKWLISDIREPANLFVHLK